MSKKIYDIAVLGGGIYGMTITKLLKTKYPSASIVLFENKMKTFFEKDEKFFIPINSNYMYKSSMRKYSLIDEGIDKLKKFCIEKEINIIEKDQIICAFKQLEKKRMQEISDFNQDNLLDISPEQLLTNETSIKSEKALDNYDIYQVNNFVGLVDIYKIHKVLYKDLQEFENLDLIFDANVDRLIDENETYKINVSCLKNKKEEFLSKKIINCTGPNSLKLAQNLGIMNNYSNTSFYLNYYTTETNYKYPENIISSPPFLTHPGVSFYKWDKFNTIGPTIHLNKPSSSFLEKLKNTYEWFNIHQIYHKNNIDTTMDHFYNNITQTGLFFYQLFGVNFFRYSNGNVNTFEHSIIYSKKENKIEEDFIFLKDKNSIHMLNFNLSGGFTSFIPASEEVLKLL